jgi:folate-dependent phosphoribosylglycinamide formyltransferase PurN/acyl carrier protein
MDNTKIVFIGKSIMLSKCLEIISKYYKNIFVITDDHSLKKNYLKKVKFIKLKNIKKIRPDYLFSVLNEKILQTEYLKFVKKHSINFHDGPLPKYAGLFSSSWAIYNSEREHGVCWHKIEKTLDTGDILFQKKFSIKKNVTAYEVDTKGIIEGIKLFKKIVKNIKNSSFKFKKQNLKKRSYFGKQDLKIIFKEYIKNKKNKNLLRAFSLSSDKEKILSRFFNVKLSLFKKENKDNFNITNEYKLKKLINFVNKTIKTDFKFDKKKIYKLKNYSLNNHPKWDSLAHVKLLSNIEKKFNISITEKNISNFNSVQLMFNAIFDKI